MNAKKSKEAWNDLSVSILPSNCVHCSISKILLPQHAFFTTILFMAIKLGEHDKENDVCIAVKVQKSRSILWQ